MDTESKQLLRDLRSSLDQFTRQAGSLSKLAQRNAPPPARSGSNSPGHAGDEFEDWWDKRKRDWEESAESVGKFRDRMDSGAESIGKGFKSLAKSSDQAAQGFQDLSRKLFGGAIGGVLIGGFTSYTLALGKTYQEMSESGTRFSDSLFGMAKSALDTGTSLEEFSRINKRNSTVAAALSGGSGPKGGLVGLAAQVRKNAEQFGSFGYTVGQLDDVVGDYAETMRLQGRTADISRGDAAESFLKVAATADTLASQFGKSRKEIMDTAMAAQRDEVYRAKLAGMTSEQAKQYGDSFGSAIMGLSAQAGDAGKMLSKMLAQTAAFDGRSYNTSAARELFNKVLPEGTEQMRQLAQNISGDGKNAMRYQNDFVKSLKASIAANRQNLMYLAEGTGAEADHARQLLDMDSNLKEASEEQVQLQIKMGSLQKKNQEALTKVTMNLENIWMRLSSAVLGKFLPLIQGPMEAIARGLEKFSESPAWANIEARFGEVGKTLTSWIDGLTNSENMNALAEWIGDTVTSLGGWVASITASDITGVFTTIGAIGLGVVSVFKGVYAAVDSVIGAFKSMGVSTEVLTAAAAALGLAFVGIKAMSFFAGIKDSFTTLFGGGKNMNITAGVVNLHGPHAPAVGGGGGGGGRLGRFGKTALIAGGIAAVAGGVYALDKNFGIFSGLFNKDAKDRKDEAKKNNASTAELPEVLDDYNRQVLMMKAERGTATDAELAALKKDTDAVAARSARATQDNPADPATTGSIGKEIEKPSMLSNIAAAIAPVLAPGLMATVGGAISAAKGALGFGGAAAGAAGAAGVAGAAGGIMGFAGKLLKGIGTVAKAAPLLGAGISAISTGMEALDLKGQHDRGEITDDEYNEALTKAVTAGIVGAIPGVGLVDALTGGIGSDALGGAIYNGAIKKNQPANPTPVQAAQANAVTPQVTNMEQRVAEMQVDASRISAGASNMDDAMLKQFEEMNNRLLALIQLYRDGTDRMVRATDRTSQNLNNLST